MPTLCKKGGGKQRARMIDVHTQTLEVNYCYDNRSGVFHTNYICVAISDQTILSINTPIYLLAPNYTLYN